jgi:hypothetical protein
MFAGRLVAENGIIKLLRESLNVIAAAQDLNARGVAELPLPEARSSLVRSARFSGEPADATKAHDVAGGARKL